MALMNRMARMTVKTKMRMRMMRMKRKKMMTKMMRMKKKMMMNSDSEPAANEADKADTMTVALRGAREVMVEILGSVDSESALNKGACHQL